MSTADLPTGSRIAPIVLHQERYTRRRRILRDVVLRRFAFGLLWRVQTDGTGLVPPEGPLIVIMNHIGAIDPFVVVGAITNRLLTPMSKIENYRHPIVGLMARAWGVYTVRRGAVDRQALDSTIALLRQGSAVLIAPEGTRHPCMADPKDGTTYVATKANAVIQPMGLDGTDLFLGSLRRLRRTPVTVRFGRPFCFRTDGRTRIPRDELRQMTREMMYQIALLVPEQRRGIYHDLSQLTTDTLQFVE
ncbi:MAG: lysophospholipid acyltransferase family protein [Anaerolineae bacterium]|nr:lysophospholipid acyltransferase family protein [Anaerolineae bacterium]